MESNSAKLKRLPAIRCRIKDLDLGTYNEQEKVLSTIFGNIKRARLYGILLFKKISENKDDVDINETMIKSVEENTNRISFLIDDGSGSIWINLTEKNIDYYENLNPGDIIHTVGYVKKRNDKVVFYADFVTRVKDPNSELIHLLEMIKKIKLQGKFKIDSINNNELLPSISEEDIDRFIKQQPEITHNANSSKSMDEFDEFDMVDENNPHINEENFEQLIIDYISRNDQGDGVSFNSIVSHLGIDKKKVENSLKRLSINMKIFTTISGNYQIYKTSKNKKEN